MLQHSAAFKRLAEKRPHIDATLLDPEAELEAREGRRIQRPEPNEAYVGTYITKWNSSNRQNRQCHSVLNYFYHVSISDSSSKSDAFCDALRPFQALSHTFKTTGQCHIDSGDVKPRPGADTNGSRHRGRP